MRADLVRNELDENCLQVTPVLTCITVPEVLQCEVFLFQPQVSRISGRGRATRASAHHPPGVVPPAVQTKADTAFQAVEVV